MEASIRMMLTGRIPVLVEYGSCPMESAVPASTNKSVHIYSCESIVSTVAGGVVDKESKGGSSEGAAAAACR